MLVRQPGVEGGVLPGGEGVHLAADRVDGLGDLARRAALGALEQQVLEEVRRAGQLVAASSRPPTPTHTPSVTERASGMRSVTTRRPLASSVIARLRGDQLPPTRAASTAAGGGHRRGAASVTAGRRRRPARRRLGRAEVAELLADLGLEGVLERHGGLGVAVAAEPVCRSTARRVRSLGRSHRSPRSPLAGRRSRRRRAPTERERDLAVGVDVVDPHLELVAEVEDVLDLVDALAAAELGDVDQAVAAREDVDERTELGDVHDPALVDWPDLGRGRVEDQLDLAPGLVDRAPVDASRCVTVPTMPSSSTPMSAPVSCWMALMTLPLGPMTSPILSIGISKLTIFGAVVADLVAGLGDGARP